jgi:hypothetical protein
MGTSRHGISQSRGLLVALIVVVAFIAREGAACMVCDTPVGVQIRGSVFDESFGMTLAQIMAPFPILFAAVALLHRGWPRQRQRATRRRSAEVTNVE